MKLKLKKPVWNRKRLKHGSYSLALSAVVVAGAVVLNVIASELPSQYAEIDMTSRQLSVLGDQTKELLDGLTEDITFYYIVQDSNRDTTVSRLLERYADYSSHIRLEEKDPVLSPQFTSQYTSDSVTENSVIVVCGEQSRVVSYDTMYESEFNYSYYSYETTGFDAEGQLTSAIAALTSGDLPKLYTLSGHGELEMSDTLLASIEKENMETETLNLITADTVPEDADCLLILSPTQDISTEEADKVLSYLQNGGQAVILTDYTDTEMPNLSSVLEYYGTELVDGVVIEGDSNHYVQVPYYLVPDINSTDVSEDLAGGSAYVLLAAAQGLQTSAELRDGVNVTGVLTSSSSSYSKTDVQNMSTYEKEDGDQDGPFNLGVLITEEVELAAEEMAAGDEDSEDAGTEAETAEDGAPEDADAEAETEENGDSEDAGAEAETAEDESTEDGTVEAVESSITEATSAEQSENDGETETEAETETETEVTASAAAAVTGETRLAVFTSSTLLDDSANQMVSGGNYSLFLNTLSWACGNTVSVSVPVKSLSVSYLTLTSASSSFWSIVTIAVIPGAFLISGLYIWLRRRKQ